MTINVTLEGFSGLSWSELWPRHKRFGNCEAWVGGGLAICVTQPFTAEEDQLFRWVLEQDTCVLYGIHHMKDGRDLIVFDRTFTTQTREEAIREHQEHLRQLLKETGLVALSFG